MTWSGHIIGACSSARRENIIYIKGNKRRHSQRISITIMCPIISWCVWIQNMSHKDPWLPEGRDDAPVSGFVFTGLHV